MEIGAYVSYETRSYGLVWPESMENGIAREERFMLVKRTEATIWFGQEA
jgi:hypothetical protein